MAVKKVGEEPNVVKRVTCRKCSSILEYLPIDVKERTVRDYTGDPDEYHWIICPECGKEVSVRIR